MLECNSKFLEQCKRNNNSFVRNAKQYADSWVIKIKNECFGQVEVKHFILDGTMKFQLVHSKWMDANIHRLKKNVNLN